MGGLLFAVAYPIALPAPLNKRHPAKTAEPDEPLELYEPTSNQTFLPEAGIERLSPDVENGDDAR
jgi:hypothetical protein